MVLCVRFVIVLGLLRYFHWTLEQQQPMRLGLKN